MREFYGTDRPPFRDTYLALVLSQHRARLALVAGILLLLPVIHAVSWAKRWMERQTQQHTATARQTVAMVEAPQAAARDQAFEAAPATLKAERRTRALATPSPRPPLGMPVPAPSPVQLSIPGGTAITVVLTEAIATDRNVQGDTFQAALAEDIASGGRVVVRVWSGVRGRIVELKGGSRGEPPVLVLRLESIEQAVGPVEMSTDPLLIQGERQSRLKRILKGAGGAVMGVIVGKKAGGTKGAAVGGAMGVATVLMAGNHFALPEGTRIQFRLTRPVRVAARH